MFPGALPAALLARLDRLRLCPLRPLPGPWRGDLRSIRRGTSLEFADYRAYHPGDDERRIDWYVAARTGDYVVRVYEDEENLQVDLLLDRSASMGFGRPDKLSYAASAAAAIGYVALRNGHQVAAIPFADGLAGPVRPLHGLKGAPDLFRQLAAAQAFGGTAFLTSLRERVAQERRPGLTFILSDLYDGAWRAGVDLLLQHGREVCLLHVLTPAETRPDAEGAFEWIDAETGERLEIAVDGDTLALYAEAFASWMEGIRSFCALRGVRYVPVTTDVALEQLLLVTLRKEGILR